MKLRIQLFALLLFVLVPLTALAVPTQIPYSGQLSESGTPVNGTRDLTMRIYDVPTGGAALYTESFTVTQVTNGVFHVMLSPPDTVWTGADRWLGVSVNGGSELTPRTKIGSVPYAVRASVAQTVSGLPTIPADPFPGSTILTSSQKFQLNDWAGSPFEEWTLCYRKSTHGTSVNTFHSQCDRRGPSIVILSLANGKIIGGYTSVSWSNACECRRSNDDAFLFSLTASKKYPMGSNPAQAVGHFSSRGVVFGTGSDLSTSDASPVMDQWYSCFPMTFVCNGLEGSSDPTCQSEFFGASCGPPPYVSAIEVEVWLKPR